mmetsp:Transcript_6757/g.13173  ORF Transcript_6757/g.13173 Transcript_6757/m.13173 type:complete len:257 (-) Transcript_6757:793-1563(-)
MTEGAATSDYALGEGGGPKSNKDRAAEAAGYVKSKGNEIIEMAEAGPLPLRVLAFLGGIAMIAASIIDAVRGMWHLDVIHVMVSVYVCLFGALICVLEGAQFLPSRVTSVQGSLYNNARFLRFSWGRGLLFFFAGSLQFSHWSMLNCIVGTLMMLLGIVSILTGRRAANKLGDLRRAIPDESALQRQFTAHVSVDGFLDLENFTNLVGSVGLQFGQNETEAAFAAIDKDNDGQISYEDMKEWYQSSEADGMPFAQV